MGATGANGPVSSSELTDGPTPQKSKVGALPALPPPQGSWRLESKRLKPRGGRAGLSGHKAEQGQRAWLPLPLAAGFAPRSRTFLWPSYDLHKPQAVCLPARNHLPQTLFWSH